MGLSCTKHGKKIVKQRGRSRKNIVVKLRRIGKRNKGTVENAVPQLLPCAHDGSDASTSHSETSVESWETSSSLNFSGSVASFRSNATYTICKETPFTQQAANKNFGPYEKCDEVLEIIDIESDVDGDGDVNVGLSGVSEVESDKDNTLTSAVPNSIHWRSKELALPSCWRELDNDVTKVLAGKSTFRPMAAKGQRKPVDPSWITASLPGEVLTLLESSVKTPATLRPQLTVPTATTEQGYLHDWMMRIKLNESFK